MPLDEGVAEIAREVGLLEIRLVVRPRREHDHARLFRAPRCQRGERGLHLPEVARDALDAAISKRLGQHTRGDQTIGQRVAGARGNLRAVVQHPPSPIRRARHVRRVEVHVNPARRLDAVRRAEEVRLRKKQRRREPAGAEKFLRPVAVGEHAIDEHGPLHERAPELRPLRAIEHERHGVEPPRPLAATRVAIHIIRDALLDDDAPRAFRPLPQFAGPEAIQLREQFLPMRTRLTGAPEHLVESIRLLDVARCERCGRSGIFGSFG